MGFLLKRGEGVKVFEYHELQRRALEDVRARFHPATLNARVRWADEETAQPPDGAAASGGVRAAAPPAPDEGVAAGLDERRLAAFGWGRIEESEVREMAESGKEPISGLGWDGPLAALSQKRRNVSDYFHERVAVVTNPAIDREREADHFSTRVFLGARPTPAGPSEVGQIELSAPLLFGGVGASDEGAHAAAARATKQRTLAEVLALCEEIDEGAADGTSEKAEGVLRAATIETTFGEDETLELALARVCEEAARLVRESRTSVLILDDARAHSGARLGIDAHLALADVDARLRDERDAEGVSLRRRACIVLRAASLRNVHDLVFALGCGADAVNPYALFDVAARGAESFEERVKRLVKISSALSVGVEKVLSTMGIHELDGYGRLFASVGLAPDVEEFFGVANYCGSAFAGLSLVDLERDARARLAHARGESDEEAAKKHSKGLPGEFREQPSLWNVAGRVARGEKPYAEFAARLQEIEETKPVALRQLLDIRASEDELSSPRGGEVDTRAGRHAAPFYFSAMSFGSQGETSFRAYAEGAKRLDIVCVNGEGGEIPDMLGRYREHRGQQVASGRFGVNARLLNSCDLLEIKIGQGAKPGEGGLLPGFKVTARIAETRHTPAGIDLISPSNNHDIYSIEDLAQVVEELKTINPRAKISVKIPAIPHLGPIATGIAKARADVIANSGYDGGTGAARKHSLRHTGLPVEIGLREAHRALIRAGLRGRVELWADGGVKSGRDVVRLMMLGADRVGFATMAMAAIGCTSCRECNTGTCHVGITSQLKSPAEALAAGQKHFKPREYELAVEHIVRFFGEVKEEIARETARAGLSSTRELVGRVDLLEQVRGHDRLDLAWLLEPEGPCALCASAQEPTVGRARRSLTSLTRDITNSVTELAGAGKEVVYYDDSNVSSGDRALGTHLAGKLTRARLSQLFESNGNGNGNGNGSAAALGLKRAVLKFLEGSVPGNGLGAFNSDGVDIVVHGGVQDGGAKGASGGRIRILKGINHDGVSVDGSVGKCFAYGAQAGLLVVQGDADSRAGIRLSGADLIFGGRLRGRLRDELGNIAARANLKGFAFEYMTSGRGLVLGDPGPWLCSGMTGGVVYLLLERELGLDEEAIRRRLAAGARVSIERVEDSDESNLRELLGHYREALAEGQQHAEAEETARLADTWRERFVKLVPRK
jgi:glutamate synthase (NADPH/NADH) large chain